MPRLYVLSGDDIGATHDFESGAVLGRGKAADVVLAAPSVSRQHARIELQGDEWVVVDLGSSNGIRVDDRRVTEAALYDGAMLVLGELELRFGIAQPAEGAKPGDRPSPVRRVAETTFSPQPPVDLGTPGGQGDTGEIELEGEWDEVVPDVVPTRRAPSAASTSASPSAPQRAPTRDREDARVQAMGGAAAAGERRTTSGKRVLQYHKVENTGGLLGAELSQQPFLVRWLLYLLAAGLFAGLAWGAYRLTGVARQSADMVRDVDE
jgi:hypothetical protein